jgi:hypothetical protein
VTQPPTAATDCLSPVEVKGKSTKPYGKSRLIIQGYQDDGKDGLLTQSPTIQRASQRLLLAVAPSLLKEGMTLSLRDITQAYPQSKTELNRVVLAQLPKELVPRYPKDTILRLINPLYGIAEAGVHWFQTYQNHHINEMRMSKSTFDPCFLIADKNEPFGAVGLANR